MNVRILAATNRKLGDEVKAGRFREDLYYRINVLSLELPPLRDRADDVLLLVDHFLGADWKIHPEALQAIRKYSWPGNVRQLINAIDRGKILADDQLIRLDDLPHDVADSTLSAPIRSVPSDDGLASIERAHVVEILKRERGNKSCAARALGVNRRSLYRLLEKYNIDPENPS